MKPEHTVSFFRSLSPKPGNLELMEIAKSDSDLKERYAKVDVLNVTEEEVDTAVRAVHKIRDFEELNKEEHLALEAIILPGERPVVDVVDNEFGEVESPFTHFGFGDIKAGIVGAIPSVGRIAMPDLPSYPVLGTGFVVGENLLMTNRHVAELFSKGLGLDGLIYSSGDADIDFRQELGRVDEKVFKIETVLLIHPYWDMALLKVSGLDISPLPILAEDPRDLLDREIAVLGYPAFDHRNNRELQNRIFRGEFDVKRMQPGRLKMRRDIPSFKKTVSAVTHDATTLGGNSGSVILDVESGKAVALHFAGMYRDANFAVPMFELGKDLRLHDVGIDFGGAIPLANTGWDTWWVKADPQRKEIPVTPGNFSRNEDNEDQVLATPGLTWKFPVELTVSLASPASFPATSPSGDFSVDVPVPITEAKVEPWHEDDRSNRKGYDSDFLDCQVSLPLLNENDREFENLAKLQNGSVVVPYEHFSLVMHHDRRLPLYTASNVDGRPHLRKPESGKKYTRRGLSGLGNNDREKWFTDPRLPADSQLPDRFFNMDRRAFDKGHIVRRDDVTWGDSYEQIRRANGDTYHATNCSPQIGGFNQAHKGGIWGKLENLVLKQAEDKDQKYTLFSGPVLGLDDPVFRGKDDFGEIFVQIPRRYWKVVVWCDDGELKTYAFILEQNLGDVDFGIEFAVPGSWNNKQISLSGLEEVINCDGDIDLFLFPDNLHNSDKI